MRIKLYLFKASFEFSFRPEQRKVPDTADLNIVTKKVQRNELSNNSSDLLENQW